MNSPWLSSEQAAQYLQIDRRTLLEWARQGKVKGYKLSGVIRHVWRFKVEDLNAMLCPMTSAVPAEGGSE